MSKVRVALPAALLVIVLLPLAPAARGDDGTRGADEAALREAGLGADGPAVLAFFRKRTLDEGDRSRLAATVRRLGDNAYSAREKASQEVVAADRAALPYLQSALKDPDLEIARRAQRCIEAIEGGAGITLELAAARLLAYHNPPGAAEVILDYLPFVDGEDVEEELLGALAVVGLRGDKPDARLVAAVQDARSPVRSAVALILGQSPRPDQRALVAPLLADADPKVRLRAAQGLTSAKETSALPVLIALLADAPLPLAAQAEETLYLVAGEQTPRATHAAAGLVAPLGDAPLGAAARVVHCQTLDLREQMPQICIGAGSAEERRKSGSAWSQWWENQGARIDLAGVDFQKRPLGLTLVIVYDGYANGQGRVWEFGPDRRPRWSIDTNIQGPIDGQILPGNRLLLAEYNASRVTERDFKGKILWEHHVNGNPVACQRLPNGNTFIATLNSVVEVTHQGKPVYQFATQQNQITFAQKLRNGRILHVASNGMLTEMDDKGKVLKSVRVGGNGVEWLTFEQLPGCRFLVPQQSGSRLLEYDASGKALRSVAVPYPPYSATRQRNGNTIACSMNNSSIFEVNRAGRVIWQEHLQGRPFRVARR